MKSITMSEVKKYIESLRPTDEEIKEAKISGNKISFKGMSIEEKTEIIRQNNWKNALILGERNLKGIIESKDNTAFALHSTKGGTPPNWYFPIFYSDLSELILYNN